MIVANPSARCGVSTLKVMSSVRSTSTNSRIGASPRQISVGIIDQEQQLQSRGCSLSVPS
jgi:hypothetical protein